MCGGQEEWDHFSFKCRLIIIGPIWEKVDPGELLQAWAFRAGMLVLKVLAVG